MLISDRVSISVPKYEFQPSSCLFIVSENEEHVTVKIYAMDPYLTFATYRNPVKTSILRDGLHIANPTAWMICSTGWDIPVVLELQITVGELANMVDLASEYSRNSLLTMISYTHHSQLTTMLPEVKSTLFDFCPKLKDYLEFADSLRQNKKETGRFAVKIDSRVSISSVSMPDGFKTVDHVRVMSKDDRHDVTVCLVSEELPAITQDDYERIYCAVEHALVRQRSSRSIRPICHVRYIRGKPMPINMRLIVSVADLANMADLADEPSMALLCALINTTPHTQLANMLPEVTQALVEYRPELRDYLETTDIL